jgi:hypothetical protein
MAEAPWLRDVPAPIVKAVSAAAKLSDREVAARLLDILGPTVTAAIGGAKETRIAHQWAKNGYECQRAGALRAALLASVAISTNYRDDGARAWFTSTNPSLDWKAPLVFVRTATEPEQFDRLIQVAAEDAR